MVRKSKPMLAVAKTRPMLRTAFHDLMKVYKHPDTSQFLKCVVQDLNRTFHMLSMADVQLCERANQRARISKAKSQARKLEYDRVRQRLVRLRQRLDTEMAEVLAIADGAEAEPDDPGNADLPVEDGSADEPDERGNEAFPGADSITDEPDFAKTSKKSALDDPDTDWLDRIDMGDEAVDAELRRILFSPDKESSETETTASSSWDPAPRSSSGSSCSSPASSRGSH